jgi:hypothetical protein
MNTNALLMTAIISFASVIALFILVGLPVWLGIRHARFERQLRHTEKMKALEMGLTPADESAGESEWTPLGVAAAIGVWVPIAVFGGALAATFFSRVNLEIWMAALGIGMTGIICGTIMMFRLPARPAGSGSRSQGVGALPSNKSAIDPDAFDTAGRRG